MDIQYHHDPKGSLKFKHDTPDDEWLHKVGARGWIAFSHDRRFHKETPSYTAIRQHRMGCFYLWGGQDLAWSKLQSFAKGFEKIAQAARAAERPFIFEVSKEGALTSVDLP